MFTCSDNSGSNTILTIFLSIFHIAIRTKFYEKAGLCRGIEQTFQMMSPKMFPIEF